MITAIIFIVVIGVLVLVHELGHFIMAKRAGMKVEEFGLGFPPTLWKTKRGGTVYAINAIPFGGYVKIFGEDDEEKKEPGSFASKSLWARFKVVAAGVTMNFLLAAFLLMLGNFLGLRIGLIDDKNIPTNISDPQVQVIQVVGDSPAEKAGLRLLDEIEGFKLSDGTVRQVKSSEDVQTTVSQYAGQKLKILIDRAGEKLEYEVEPRKDPPAGQGAMGISLATTGIVSYPWYEAIWRGVYNAVILTFNTIIGYYMLIKQLLFTGSLVADVSGPIGIATLTGQAARIGINYLLQFVAMISINLAVLNFIPFPALDGGRAVLLLVEKFRRKPLPKRVEGLINSVGFSLLIALMVYVTIKDVGRFF